MAATAVPGGQRLQLALPVSAANVPTGQFEQKEMDDEPVLGAYVPTGQPMQSMLCDSSTYLPASHAMQATDVALDEV